VTKFCESIGLEVSQTKTKITNINTDKALFLGTNILRAGHRDYVKLGPHKSLRRIKKGLRFEAPIQRIAKKLSEANFMKNGASAPKFR